MTDPTTFPATILVVDDEPIMIRLLGELLQGRYTLDFAVTGADALSSAASSPPDLILLDIELPDMSGYEVCRGVRNNPATSSIPVIFLTSNDQQSDMVSGYEAGGTAYVCKPFNVMELIHHIDLQLPQRRHGRPDCCLESLSSEEHQHV